MLGRRDFVKSALLASAFPSSPCESAQAQEQLEEEQAGDPDRPPRTVVFNPKAIDVVVDPGKSLGLRKDPQQIAQQILRIGESNVGISEDSNPEFVETLFKVLNVPSRKNDGTLQPFCAAGVSFAACTAYCDIDPSKISHDETNVVRVFRDVLSDINKFYFLPHCATRYMVEDSKRRGTWVDASRNRVAAHPGWLAFFSWRRNKLPNHVGIVKSSHGGLKTIEYNTSSGSGGSQSNGGVVASRDRTADMDYVMGYIAID